MRFWEKLWSQVNTEIKVDWTGTIKGGVEARALVQSDCCAKTLAR